jgi:membrane protease YdiL (CAAX protease family)
MAALVTTAYAAYAASASPFIRDHMLRPGRWRPYAWIHIVAVPMALISGFFEEAFFRKALMDYVMHRGAGIIVQLAITATVFGAAHAIWGLMGGSVRGAVGAMAATGILGAALGIIYIVGGRSVGPCMAAHIAINLLIEPWLILAAATHSWRQRKSGV